MPSNYGALFGDSEFDEGSGSSRRKTKKEQCKTKLSTIEKSKRLRKEQQWDERWADFIKLYSNQYPYAELADYDDVVVPNMLFSTVNVIVPSIAVAAPKVAVSAKRPQDEGSAEVAEAVVNHQWRQYDVQDQVREAVKDFVILGHGWVKVTWDTQVGERELTGDEWRQMAQQALLERQQGIDASDLGEDEFPSVEDIIGSLPKTVEEVIVDAPKVTRVSPFDMFVDPDALRLQDARWIAQRSFIPIQVVRKNQDYSSSVRNKLKPTVMSEARDVDVMDSSSVTKGDVGFVVVYEYYDLINKTVCTVAEGADDYLIDPQKSPFVGVHPFVFLENYEVPERFYPIGDIETVYALQLELALARTALTNDRKRGRRINMVRSAAIGPDGMEQLESGVDNVLLEVVGNENFSEVFAAVSSAGLDSSWYMQSDQIITDINTISGISEYARGQTPEIRRTATEAGLIQDAANARSADKLAKVEKCMGRVAERMIRLAQQFMDTEDVARVVSDDQVVSWVDFSRETLQGDFVFEVEAGSSQPQNESMRRQSALQLMDVMSPVMGSGLLNDQKFIEHVLRNGFGIKNAEEFMGPGLMPPPGPEGAGGEQLPPEAQLPPGMPPM